MSAAATLEKEGVLNALILRPSRSSAAAIGEKFVLNGAPAELQDRALHALAGMNCDLSVAVLLQVIGDPSRRPGLRRQAIAITAELVEAAIARGYEGLSLREVRELAKDAHADLDLGLTRGRAAGALCGHLSRAVSEGIFGGLPDF